MVQSAVKITYLGGVGLFRRQMARLDGKWPNFLLNTAAKQGHIVTEAGTVFPVRKPQRVATFREMVEMDLRPPLLRVDGLMMLCEENCCWPVSTNPLIDPARRAQEYQDADEEGVQAARVQAARDDHGNGLMSMAFLGALAVSAVFMLMIVAATLPIILSSGEELESSVEVKAP